jgi:hypothetical protein
VYTTEDAAVFDTATSDNVTATSTRGSEGRLLDGPHNTRWFVDFTEMTVRDGWVSGEALMVSSGNHHAGQRIEVTESAGVWSSPGSSEYRGVQEAGAFGTIVESGPFENLVSWWLVDFDAGVDGWVDGSFIQRATLLDRAVRSTVAFMKKGALAFSLLLLAGVLYLAVRIDHIKREEKKKFVPPSPETFVMAPEEMSAERARWGRIEDLVNSAEPGNWKLAILEADIMLDKMLLAMGFMGETIGDRLKAIEPSDFMTLNQAWEAHKIRNTIAHEGTDFLVTQREAKRVLKLFEEVFREFDYI